MKGNQETAHHPTSVSTHREFPDITVLPFVAFDKKACISQNKMQLLGSKEVWSNQNTWIRVLILLLVILGNIGCFGLFLNSGKKQNATKSQFLI